MVPPALAALVLVVSAGAGMVISMAAVVLRELAEPSGIAPGRLAALFLCAIPENLGYRQIRNLWLIAGFFGVRPPKTESRAYGPGPRARERNCEETVSPDYRPDCSSNTSLVFVPPRRISVIDTLSPVPV